MLCYSILCCNILLYAIQHLVIMRGYTVLYCMKAIHHYIVTVLYGNSMLYHITHYTFLYYNITTLYYCTIFCCTTLDSITLYYTTLHDYTILHHTIFFCTKLNYTILHYTTLYYSTLYYTIKSTHQSHSRP